MGYNLNTPYDFDFELIGLVCAEKPYKVAWLVNNALNISLSKEENILMEFLQTDKLYILNYIFQTENNTFRLFKNRSVENGMAKKPYLLPELSQYDYFLLVKDQTGCIDMETLVQKIKGVKHFQYHQKFDPNKLKSRENLIFD